MNDLTTSPETGSQPGLDLQIHGGGLLLSGNFGAWQSRVILGPDLDDVGVTLFVDATSVVPAPTVQTENLFTFHSRSVKSLGKGRYKVLGDFTGAEPTRELTVDVETPLGHTPLIALSFSAEKKDFGEHWSQLVENATLFGKIPTSEGPQREAAGWLTTPTVAAA